MRIDTFISGLFLVLVGTALLLINFGYGSWNIIWLLSKWWPVLLIFLGLSLFNSGRIPRQIAIVLLLLSVLGVCAYFIMASPDPNFTEEHTASTLLIGRQKYALVKHTNLTVDLGGGQLQLSPVINVSN